MEYNLDSYRRNHASTGPIPCYSTTVVFVLFHQITVPCSLITSVQCTWLASLLLPLFGACSWLITYLHEESNCLNA